MAVIHNLRQHIAEKTASDKKSARDSKRKAELEAAKGVYQQVKEAYPGEEIFACVVSMVCPWSRCGQRVGLATFFTQALGENYHTWCPKCNERIITLRDTVEILGSNTYPVDFVREHMRKQPGKYDAHIAQLMAGYAVMSDHAEDMHEEGRTRKSEMTVGEKGNRPITVSMKSETPEEALEGLKATRRTRSSTTSPLEGSSLQEALHFFNDPDVSSKYRD